MDTYKLRMNESREISLVRVIAVPFLILFLLSIYSSLTAFAQESFTLTNYFTPHYRDFTMMKISIVPPAGFAKDTDQVGFLDVKDAAAIRAEEIKKGVHEVSTIFLKRFDSTGHNDSLGLQFISQINFTINRFEAHLLNLSGIVDGDEYLQRWLFIGDTGDTYIVKGFIPEKKKKVLEQQVHNALLSVFYEPDRRLIPPGGDATGTSSSSCSCHNQK